MAGNDGFCGRGRPAADAIERIEVLADAARRFMDPTRRRRHQSRDPQGFQRL